MGRVLSTLESRAPASRASRLAFGAAAGLGLPLVWGLIGWCLEACLPWPLQALVLKPAFAGRALLLATTRVERQLRDQNLTAARAELQSLVSRPTSDLDTPLIAAAAIESVAENFVDSWLAPLLAYALFGLGGAYAYRAANTADAMWGYHTREYEWLGKVPARLDDVLNWGPSRVGAMILAGCGPRPLHALQTWLRDARRTESPNAGQSMAACAGQLDLRLEKVGHYVLNASGRQPGVEDIATARRLVARGMLVSTLVTLVLRRYLNR